MKHASTEVTVRLAADHCNAMYVTAWMALGIVRLASRRAAVTSQPQIDIRAAPVSGMDETCTLFFS